MKKTLEDDIFLWKEQTSNRIIIKSYHKSKQDESWHTLNLKSLACIERSAELGEIILFQIAALCK